MHSPEDLKAALKSELLQFCTSISKLEVDSDSLRDTLFDEDPVDVACSLLNTNKYSIGFIELCAHDRPRDTIEAIVLRPEYTQLFTEEVLRQAGSKLAGAPALDEVRTTISSNVVVSGVRSSSLAGLRLFSQEEIEERGRGGLRFRFCLRTLNRFAFWSAL